MLYYFIDKKKKNLTIVKTTLLSIRFKNRFLISFVSIAFEGTSIDTRIGNLVCKK